MNTIEDQLRDAYRAAADTVRPGAIAPLPDRLTETRRAGQAGDQDPGQRRPLRHWPTLLSLGAAVAAAAVIVATAVVVPRLWPGHGASEGSPSQSPAIATAPRYFAEVLETQDQRPMNETALRIINSATGAITARLAPPRSGMYFQAVAALGSDNQFIAAATAGTQSWKATNCTTWLYQFRLTSAGKPVGLHPLSVPKIAGFQAAWALTASADGQVIAYNTLRCGHHPYTQVHGQVGTIDLKTGATSTWTYRWPAEPSNLSLTADGSQLSLVSNPSNGTYGQFPDHNSVWMLPASSPSGPLSKRYHQVIAPRAEPLGATVSQNGTTIFALSPVGQSKVLIPELLAAYSATTGKRIAAVTRFPKLHGMNQNPELAASASGRYLLLSSWNSHAQLIDLATGRVVRVPGPNAFYPQSVAW